MNQTTVNRPKMFTLVVLSGLAVASLNMFQPSLPRIAADFDATYAYVNLAIAGYAAMTAVLQLILGPLSDRFGRRPVLLGGLSIFCLASLGCALAASIETFLSFRMIQAVIISGFTVSQAVIRDTSTSQASASLMGYLAMAWATVPMLAPFFGGLLEQFFGWRASFWAFLCLGVVAFTLSWFDLRETNTARSHTLTAQLRTYPELARSRRFWGYALCQAFSVGGYYAFLGAAPLAATVLFQVQPATLGLYIGSITAGFIFGSFLSGRLASRHALTNMMIVGRLVACFGLTAGLVVLWSGFLHEITLFGACIFVGIGNGLTLPSGSAGAMSVRPKLAGSASGLTGALMVAVGAVISAVTGAVLTPENVAHGMLGMMLLSVLLSLAAALYVRQIDRRVASD